MAVAFRDKTLATAGSATGFTAVEPAGSAENDALLMLIIIQSVFSAFSGPSGWTQLVDLSNGGNGTGQNFGAYLYGIRRGSSAPSLAVSWTTSRFYEVGITAWTGVRTTGNIYDVIASRYRSAINPAAPDCLSVTTTIPNTEVVALGVSWTGCTTAFTPPSGYTIRDAGTPGQASGVASKLVAAAGAEDPGVFGGVAAGANGVGEFTIALAPEVDLLMAQICM